MLYTYDLTGQGEWRQTGPVELAQTSFFLNNGSQLIVGGQGNDVAFFYDFDIADPPVGHWIVDSWDGLVVGGGDDTFIGANGDDTLDGEEGNDFLIGAAGNDLLYGGAGDDDLDGREGDDQMYGGGGNDTISDWGGDNVLFGGDGNDSLLGYDGGDVMYGGVGDDTLDSQWGDDTLYGGDGSDVYRIGDAGDFIIDDGASGRDMVVAEGVSVDLKECVGVDDLRLIGPYDVYAYGSETGNSMSSGRGSNALWGLGGEDTLRAGSGHDWLYGGDGADWLSGNFAPDKLFGGAGDDTIKGGFGRDTLTGDEGADQFVLASARHSLPGRARDTITDFTSGEDEIHLVGFAAGAELVEAFSATGTAELFFDAKRERLIGDVDGDGLADWSITLLGVDSISAGDLVLIS